MKKKRFNGPIGKWIKQHLALRKSLGFIYKSAEYDLDAFDQHLKNYFPNCKTISRQMVIRYLETTKKHMPLTRAHHITNLRQFCRFMFQRDPNTYIPEKKLLGPAKVQVKPYIFTKNDIVALIYQAKQFHGKSIHALLPDTYVTIIGLLWVTGMRIGEVLRLKVEDVDTVNGIIYIRQTKFFKSRIIPLSSLSIKALITYKNKRASFGYSEISGTPFFFNNRKKPCITSTTSRTIVELIRQTGLKNIHGKTPRVHDIRHSFATNWLLDFYRSGKDPTAYLPVLATYMGHANISNTQVYLHPSIELLNIAGQQLQSYITSVLGGKNHEKRK
jgi:integrase/recombinase XerD